MEMTPDVMSCASRRLLRLLYVEQLRRARTSPLTPPADTLEVPLVVIVGQEAVGKGTLARRLARECAAHVETAVLHTTAAHHLPGHYLPVSRRQFDDMLLDGDFLTYSELNGESYGLSREQASVRDGRARVASMDLLGALMLKLRGRRPYLILATCLDKCSLAERIMDRKTMRNTKADTRISRDTAYERSALQAMLSGRIMVTGIINEIILALPDEKSRSEFQMESECSLLCDSSHDRPIEFAKDVNFLTISTSSASLLDVGRRLLKKTSDNDNETSFCSLYKESVCMDEYLGELMQAAKERRKLESLRIELPQTQKKRGILSQKMRDSKSVDFSKTFSTSSKALPETKSKSVSIIPQGTEVGERSAPDYGEPLLEETKGEKSSRSSSESASQEPEDMDLWLTFLLDNGLLMSSDDVYFAEDDKRHDKMKTINDCKKGHPDFLLRAPYESLSSSTRDVYETIHRNRPGLFWDTITMDDPEKAFKKAKTIIRNIVNSQPLLKPMFETDFADDAAPCRAARARLQAVRAQIAPQQLFH